MAIYTLLEKLLGDPFALENNFDLFLVVDLALHRLDKIKVRGICFNFE